MASSSLQSTRAEAVGVALEASEALAALHGAALPTVPPGVSEGLFVLLPTDWGQQPETRPASEALLSPAAARRARRIEAVKPQRAAHYRADRAALAAACARMGLEPGSATLSHTPKGQPIVREATGAARDERPPLRVSFTHDGGLHVLFAARSPGLRGVGVDAVHLPRLATAHHDEARLRRLARRFMSERETREFALWSQGLAQPDLTRQVAAAFSLMEAASKALGTGLRIGGGIGRPGSLPLQSLECIPGEGRGELAATGAAALRLAALGSDKLEGYWATDGVYLVSIVLLWSRTRNRAPHD